MFSVNLCTNAQKRVPIYREYYGVGSGGQFVTGYLNIISFVILGCTCLAADFFRPSSSTL